MSSEAMIRYQGNDTNPESASPILVRQAIKIKKGRILMLISSEDASRYTSDKAAAVYMVTER